jgi:hypothetical protein
MSDPRYETGIQVRREVLGDQYVDRATAETSPFTAPFQEYVTRAAWGDIWSRPGLDRRTRSCITPGSPRPRRPIPRPPDTAGGSDDRSIGGYSKGRPT